MRIFYYILFVFFIIALMNGRSLAETDPDDDLPEEDDVEGRPAGNAPNSDDLPGVQQLRTNETNLSRQLS